MFDVEVTTFGKMKTFIDQVFAMIDEDESGDDGNGDDFGGLLRQVHADEREAADGEETWQDGFAQDQEKAGEQKQEGADEVIIIDQQSTEGGGNAFSAAEPKLCGPDMSDDDGDHCQSDETGVIGEMAGDPDCESAFGNIADEGGQEAGPTQDAPDVFRADAAAAEFAEVLVSAEPDQIIASGETAQEVRAEGNGTSLAPIGRLKLFNPGHF